TKYYPKPFHFNNANKGKNFVQNVYDSIKLPSMRFIIRKYLKQNKITLLFVSEWMRTHFELNVKINKNEYMDHSIVIPNSSHPIFVDNSYQYNQLEKEADFITIRPFDNPKYGVDIVRELAIKHPELTFHVYGKGEY